MLFRSRANGMHRFAFELGWQCDLEFCSYLFGFRCCLNLDRGVFANISQSENVAENHLQYFAAISQMKTIGIVFSDEKS